MKRHTFALVVCNFFSTATSIFNTYRMNRMKIDYNVWSPKWCNGSPTPSKTATTSTTDRSIGYQKCSSPQNTFQGYSHKQSLLKPFCSAHSLHKPINRYFPFKNVNSTTEESINLLAIGFANRKLIVQKFILNANEWKLIASELGWFSFFYEICLPNNDYAIIANDWHGIWVHSVCLPADWSNK